MSDEWHTWVAASDASPINIISTLSQFDNVPYYALAKITSYLFGSVSIFSLRLPSAILGIIAIPLAYITGREYGNKITGILLSGFITLSFPFVYYSQNARSYMVVLCAFLIFTYFLVKILRGNIRWSTIILTCASVIFCFYAHPYSIIPITISFAIIMCVHFRSAIKIIIPMAACSLPFLWFFRYTLMNVYLFPSLAGAVDRTTIFWIPYTTIAWMLPFELFGFIWPVFAVLFCYALTTTKDTVARSLAIIGILTMASCIPMALVTAMSPRYALLVSPLLAVIALDPVANFINNSESPGKKIALVIAALFVFLLFSYPSLLSWNTFNVCPFV
jgi:4-amino-4-deoxy-L-arabinose transferase-like glycosyltransferase